jgi:predicted  nucleic acid-binding Zn-ribbon protein
MDWLEKLLTDPADVKRGLIAYHESLLQQHQPLLEDRKRAKALLQKDKAKLERLLDLYLEAGKDKELYLSRKISLEDSIQATEATIAEQETKLADIKSIPDQIQSVEELGDIVREGFELGIPPEETKQLIEALDVRLTLFYQDGVKWVEGNCILTLENPGKKLERIVGEPS